MQICRTCFQETSFPNFLEITNDEKSSQIKIETLLCIPEIDINLFGNPILCISCVAALNASYRFKKQCLYTEERIRSYLRNFKGTTCSNILEVYKSSHLGDLTNHIKEAVVTPRRNYIDDLNDLLDDALGSNDVQANTRESIKMEVDTNNVQLTVNNVSVSNENVPQAVENQISTKIVDSQSSDMLQCKKCNYKTNIISEYNKHEAVHFQTKPHTCTFCNFTTAYRANLNKHMLRHTTDSQKVHACSKCNFTTADQNVLKKHVVVAHASKDISVKGNPSKLVKKKLACHVCEFTTELVISLKNHLQNEHGKSLFMCTVCRQITTSESHLKQHIKVHNHEASFKCTLCDFRADNQQGISGHMRVHTNTKSFNCKRCIFNTKSRKLLIQHSMEAHGAKSVTDEPFSCTVCDFKSTKKINVYYHTKRMHGAN